LSNKKYRCYNYIEPKKKEDSNMTSDEKVENCMDLKPIKDRSEIPLYPMVTSFLGTFSGITQKAMVDDYKKWIEALKITYDHFGYPDLCLNLPIGEAIFAEGLPAKRPGYELPDNALFQFIEEQIMSVDDYREIIAKGWAPWFNRYMRSIQHPPIKTNIGLTVRWIKLGIRANNLHKTLRSWGVEPIAGTANFPLFDWLSLLRSFGEFCIDLYEEPGLIQDLLRKENPGWIKSTLTNAGRTSVKRIHVYAMRSDANSISPDIFDEFTYPCLKQIVEAFWKAGYRTVLHADGNWTPMVDRFLDLPKTSVHFEFDGVTDIFKAAEILRGHHSIRGDLPAAMLAFGTPDEVSEYCEKLITGIGMKGGFVLGSGCEVPMNCKNENLAAMMKSIKG
jgi:uroporphyrinogen decarboxylase